MITEEQRLQMLRILSTTVVDMDRIIAELKTQFGIDLTPDQIHALINQLKMVRGS